MNTQVINFPQCPSKNASLSQNDSPTFLISNLYTLTFHPGTSSSLYQYTIQVFPDIAKDNHPLLQKLKHSISHELTKVFTKYISLGYSLFTPSNSAPSTVSIPTTHQHVQYEIVLHKVSNSTIDLSNINESSPHIAKTLIEIIMKNIIYANDSIIRFHKGSFYKHNETQVIPGEKGVLIPGFTTSIQVSRNNKLYYLINTNNKYISGISAYEQLQLIKSKYNGEMFYQKCKEEFIGKSFLAKYGAFRVYKVDGIAFDKNCVNTEVKTSDKEGKELTVSIKHYYKLQYNIDIKDKQQPLFMKYYNHNSSYCCYLIPELLFMSGNKGNAKEHKRRVTTPKEKILKIQDIQLLLNNTNAKTRKGKTTKSPYELKREWGIQLHECYSFKSRILLSPSLHFANTVLTHHDNNNKPLYQYQHLINTNKGFTKCNWICVTYFHNESKCVSIISNFIAASKRLNLLIEQPHIHALNTNNFIHELKEIDLQEQLQLVLIVLCNKYSYLYKEVKQYFNMRGIPSQCILDEKAKTLSYCTKVLTQMLSKINGELFHILLDSNLNSKVSMILGIDIIHDNTSNSERVCVASTYNQFHSKVNVEVDVVKNKEMLPSTVVKLISKSLEHFNKVNKKLPSIVMAYRKGGNDVQNEKLLHSEIPFIVEAFDGKGQGCYTKGYTPMLCVIAVNTKTDLKFFQQSSTDTVARGNSSNNMYTNPEKGTVIDDDVIVNSKRFEFYLQSQYVNQGTASPVHFTVLYDNTRIPLETLENITYKQTHYYWNWNGAIRIPAILKYAEVCNAHLLKCGNDIHSMIKDRPFYL